VCADSCIDNIQNQDESDVDCGGVCPECQLGEDCNSNGDCSQLPVQLYCSGGVCVTHCGDGMTNGDETDLDCGGNECATPCMQGQFCMHGTDCISNICSSGICAP
jgi:hypothetical protein